MEYHVKGVMCDSGDDAEFQIYGRDEDHVAELANAHGVTPSRIELIGDGQDGGNAGSPPSPGPGEEHR